jgi:hypothetical protein
VTLPESGKFVFGHRGKFLVIAFGEFLVTFDIPSDLLEFIPESHELF